MTSPETYKTPNAADVDPNKITVAEFFEKAKPPEIGKAQFVLVRNPSDHKNRDPERSDFGSLDYGATEKTILDARNYFDQILDGLPQEEQKNVKILFFASPSGMKLPTGETSDYQRAVDGAAAALDGAALSLNEHNLSDNQILNTSGNNIYQPQNFVDLKILTESPDFIDFLTKKAKEADPKNWSRKFWTMYENDEFHAEREQFGAEGPIDIAERMRMQIELINNSLQYLFKEDPETRLIVWITGMYDNIQPFIEQKITGQWRAIEHGAGIAINVDKGGVAKTTIGGQPYEFSLSANNNKEEKMNQLKPIEEINLAEMLASDDPQFTKLREVVAKLKRHQHGRFILGPSGVGKTTFYESQTPDESGQIDWLDADILWYASGALPPAETKWWENHAEKWGGMATMDARCDWVTQQAKNLGLWLIGASDNGIVPDAIVIPDWNQHIAQIKHREETNYTGGARSTADGLAQVKSHIEEIETWETRGAKKFGSVKEAADYLAAQEEEK